MFGTTEKIHRAHLRVLCHAGTERVPAPAGSGLPVGNMGVFADNRNHRHRRSHWLTGLQAFPRYGKMVETGRSGQ